MRVSVLLPCYNGGATIGVQLEALSRQRWPKSAEVIVLDNGSTDDSVPIVQSFSGRLPNLRVLPVLDPAVGRLGVANSYRIGFEAAQGDAILLCEADDEVADDWCEVMLKALRSEQFVAAALGHESLNPAEFHSPDGGIQSVQTGLPTIHLFGQEIPYAFGCSFGLHRTAVERIGPPMQDCGTSWDIDYCWRASLAGIRVVFVPEAVVQYRLRHGYRSRFNQARAWASSQSLLRKKYGKVSRLRYGAMASRRMLISIGKLGPVITGRRTFRSWVWDFGWAVGAFQGMWYL